jgi:hypothetical protein
MSWGIQHPCRGLFLRYYLLKVIKEFCINSNYQEIIKENKILLIKMILNNF